jgi:hypothetical protein
VIADLSHIVEDSTAGLNQMSHQEITEMFPRMGAITRRFLATVNYRSNLALPLFPQYPQSSSNSASTDHSHAAPSSSSRPPYQVAFYPARPPAHPPLRMSPLGVPPLRDPAPGGPGPALRGPAPAPTPVLTAAALVPSSSLGPALPSGIDHYSMSNHRQILDCIN